ncbi:Unknown protein [Striga hermonthica]|uniref:Ty3 transposon capsid-like protein domain-containing protein n=1 Tax=Striga hermonthica TaxID=68872 RepID=A0A9N7NCB6_STRHE|nr:Unknown protein [Striga hermonthica]
MPPRRAPATAPTAEELAQRRIQALEDAMIAMANRQAPLSSPPANNQPTFDRFVRHRPPTYHGTPDLVVLENWIREIEKLFDATGCPEAEKVAIATYYLKAEADNWWSVTKVECRAILEFGWDQFVNKLKDRFYPTQLRWQKREEFVKLTQGSMSVQQYTDKFVELSRFAASLIPDEAERLNLYVQRMDPRVHMHVVSSGATTFQRAYEVALSIYASVQEMDTARRVQMAKRPQPATFARPPFKKFKANPVKKGITVATTTTTGQRKCYRCQKDWHLGKNCDGTTVRCNHCNEEGHRAFSYPRNPAAAQTRPTGGAAPVRNRVYNMLKTDVDEDDASADVITVILEGIELTSQLKEFPMNEFDVIFGIDWLKKHQAVFYCRDEKVVLRDRKGRRVSYSNLKLRPGVKLVSALKMKKMQRRGDQVFLCRIVPRGGVSSYVNAMSIEPVLYAEIREKQRVDPILQKIRAAKAQGRAESFEIHADEVKPNLTFEKKPIKILDRQVRILRRKEIPLVKVMWRNQKFEGRLRSLCARSTPTCL